MDTCLSELGTETIEFTFNTTNDPFNVETNTLVISMWQEVFGDQVQATITPIEQGQYIGLALVGTFNALGWRSHSGTDPDQQRLWWQSASVSPDRSASRSTSGASATPTWTPRWTPSRPTPIPAARKAAAEDVNRIFGEQVYNWWSTWTLWGILEQPYVNGVESAVMPDGEPPAGWSAPVATTSTSCGATKAPASRRHGGHPG